MIVVGTFSLLQQINHKWPSEAANYVGYHVVDDARFTLCGYALVEHVDPIQKVPSCPDCLRILYRRSLSLSLRG